MDIARKTVRIKVEQLSSNFGVSLQTIRKDLNDLCDRQLLDRLHGGAIFASSVQNLAYQARRSIAESEKRAIGRAAATLIPSNSSLFLNIGTTTEEVARALMHHVGLLLITNNLHVASMLYPLEGIDVVIAGGPVRRSDGGVVGAPSMNGVRRDPASDVFWSGHPRSGHGSRVGSSRSDCPADQRVRGKDALIWRAWPLIRER